MNKKDVKNQLSLQLAQAKELEAANAKISQEMLRSAEDKLFADSLAIVEASMEFAELGFDEQGQVDENDIPEEWRNLTKREREKRIRLAKANWMPSNEVPHGVKMAHATMMGIIKARSVEQSGTKILNIENASFPAPAPLKGDFDIIEVDE